MKASMKIMSVLALTLLLMACATERIMTTTSNTFSPTNPNTIKIYLAEKPTVPFKEIGRVSVNKHSMFATSRSGEVIYKKMREKAASIGGNAIINITEDFASMSGVVIKL